MKCAPLQRASGNARHASWRAPVRARFLSYDAIGRLHRRRPRRGSGPLLGPCRPDQPPRTAATGRTAATATAVATAVARHRFAPERPKHLPTHATHCVLLCFWPVQLVYVVLLMHYGCKHGGVGMWALAACRLRSVRRGDAENWLKFERFQSDFTRRFEPRRLPTTPTALGMRHV